jgi:hypothetical protein
MNAARNLLQSPFQLNHRGRKAAEATYYLLVVNDDSAVVSDRLNKWRVSNFQVRMS